VLGKRNRKHQLGGEKNKRGWFGKRGEKKRSHRKVTVSIEKKRPPDVQQRGQKRFWRKRAPFIPPGKKGKKKDSRRKERNWVGGEGLHPRRKTRPQKGAGAEKRGKKGQ